MKINKPMTIEIYQQGRITIICLDGTEKKILTTVLNKLTWSEIKLYMGTEK